VFKELKVRKETKNASSSDLNGAEEKEQPNAHNSFSPLADHSYLRIQSSFRLSCGTSFFWWVSLLQEVVVLSLKRVAYFSRASSRTCRQLR
jgi:hypothetical protein